MEKTIHSLVGGPLEQIPDLTVWNQEKVSWIGVDRGAIRLLNQGICPSMAIGDFDSISPEELAEVKAKVEAFQQFKAEKDETDTEIALRLAIESGAECIRIFGTTGGRLDHFLANLWMMLRPEYREAANRVTFVDVQNTITFFEPGDYVIKKEADKEYLAFVCLTPVKKLTLYDEKYQLEDADFSMPVSLASNEFIGETGRFSFTEGMVAVIQSKD